MKILAVFIIAFAIAGCGSDKNSKEINSGNRALSPPPGAGYVEGKITDLAIKDSYLEATISVEKFTGGAGAPSIKSGAKIKVHFPKRDSLAKKLSALQEEGALLDATLKAEKVFGSDSEFNWNFIGFRKNNRSNK